MKIKHNKAENEEIFNDDEDRRDNNDPFSEMRETKTGFGAKLKKGQGQLEAEGGLQPDDDDDDDDEEEIGDDDDEEGEDGVDIDEDDEEGSEHDF